MATQYAAPSGQIDHTVGTAPFTDVPAMTTNPTQVNNAPVDPAADHSAPSYDQVQPHDPGAVIHNTGAEQIVRPTDVEKGAHQTTGAGIAPSGQGHGHEHRERGPGEWKHGLFDCFSDLELCLCGTFLPCVLYGKIQHRLKKPSMADYNELNNDTLIYAGLVYCCAFQWIAGMMQRTNVREQRGIKGSEGGDCILAYCCGCCTLIQEEKELSDPLMAGASHPPQGYAGSTAQAGGMQYGASNPPAQVGMPAAGMSQAPAGTYGQDFKA